jgi:hypothetical protein
MMLVFLLKFRFDFGVQIFGAIHLEGRPGRISKTKKKKLYIEELCGKIMQFLKYIQRPSFSQCDRLEQ